MLHMILEILSGRGDSVLFARCTGVILSSSTKKSGVGGGGILSGGGRFVLHSNPLHASFDFPFDVSKNDAIKIVKIFN